MYAELPLGYGLCSICGNVRERVDLNRRRSRRGCLTENTYYCYDIKECIEKSKTFSFVWNEDSTNG